MSKSADGVELGVGMKVYLPGVRSHYEVADVLPDDRVWVNPMPGKLLVFMADQLYVDPAKAAQVHARLMRSNARIATAHANEAEAAHARLAGA